MTKLSGVIITLNEEKNILRCIHSLQKVCDEIIVLDSYSTDRTEELCRQENNVTFLQRTFDGYGQQKRAAITHCKHSFILSLDADECLSDELVQEILRIKENPTYKLYSIPRKTNYCGHWVKHGGWYPDRKIRLWHKEFGAWTSSQVHEEVVRLSENYEIKKMNHDILHFGISNQNEHYQTIEEYSNIQAAEMLKLGKSYSVLKKFLSPVFKFIEIYFLKLGFLDGLTGLTIARISAYANYLKYAKLEKLSSQNQI